MSEAAYDAMATDDPRWLRAVSVHADWLRTRANGVTHHVACYVVAANEALHQGLPLAAAQLREKAALTAQSLGAVTGVTDRKRGIGQPIDRLSGLRFVRGARL